LDILLAKIARESEISIRITMIFVIFADIIELNFRIFCKALSRWS